VLRREEETWSGRASYSNDSTLYAEEIQEAARLRGERNPRVNVNGSLKVGVIQARKQKRDDQDDIEPPEEQEHEIPFTGESRRYEPVCHQARGPEEDDCVFRLQGGSGGQRPVISNVSKDQTCPNAREESNKSATECKPVYEAACE